MMHLSLRDYTVTGRLVDSTTPGEQPGQRPETISVQVRYFNSREYDDKLDIYFGETEAGVPRIELSRHAVTQIVKGAKQSTKTASIIPGKLIRTNTETPNIIDDLCPVVFDPVELPGRPPGLTVDIGEDEYEGATLEFTPAQATDLITLFEVFTDGPFEGDFSNPILTPSQVDATGTLEEL